MKNGIVRIYVLEPPPDDLTPDRWRLSGDEVARAASFRNAGDASRWAFCRMALRDTLGSLLGMAPEDVPLVIAENGKPGLAHPHAGLHFNLSHCAELALIAAGLDGMVGIDVESTARAVDLLDCEDSFCHPAEIAELPVPERQRAARLLELWTAKEALLKALGTGLLHPPETIRMHLNETGIRVSSDTLPAGLERHVIKRIDPDLPHGFTAAVCYPQVSGILEIIQPLESTTTGKSARITAIDTRSDA